MMTEKRTKKSISRRQFIQTGATAAAGLFLAACADNPPTVATIPTRAAAQLKATNTPVPRLAITSPTDTPLPQPTATDTPVSQSTVSNTPTSEPSPTATPTPVVDEEQRLIADMTLAATAFLEALDPAQRDQAAYAFNSDERFRWHWTTPGRFPRNGLPLRQMTGAQKSRALDLLQASLSSMGFEKVLDIISLQNNLGNDPELYYVTLFGTPGTPEPWGWRWEGHHLSRQFTVVGERLATMPFFHGSWPTTTEAGLRAMASEEDAALELINSFSESEREVVVFQDRPLTRHVTQNAARVDPLAPVGILYADMTATQQQLVSEIIHAYLGTLPDHMTASSLARISQAGPEHIHFGWAGSLERQHPQYYRIQGPTFLLEFDNTRNRATHVHSVWRDFEHDFGYHLL